MGAKQGTTVPLRSARSPRFFGNRQNPSYPDTSRREKPSNHATVTRGYRFLGVALGIDRII